MSSEAGRQYNDPLGGDPSTIGTQFRTDYYQKKALIEIRKEQYFSPLADVVSMPKHMGKTIRRYHYLPILDDANINDQGIDAAGVIGDGVAVGKVSMTIILIDPGVTATGITKDPGADIVNDVQQGYFTGVTNGHIGHYFVGEAVTVFDATAAAQAKVMSFVGAMKGFVPVTYGEALYGVGGVAGAVVAGGWVSDGGYYNDTEATNVAPLSGNLYGSSKDIGTMVSKMPTLTENGGRVNRVGVTRIDLEGTLEKYGMFYDYTKESLDFDTDAELDMHCTRELLNAANEITEDLLQIDLLSSAGVLRYGGDATSLNEISGDINDEGDIVPSVITYEDLMRMEIDLDNNRCPKQTKVIMGSRMIDTRVINGARVMYIGSELIPSIRRMEDLFGNQAFISIEHYAHAGDMVGSPNTINGEIGTVGNFRIVVVPEMTHWAGAGAPVGSGTGTNPVNAGFRETDGFYDVYPMLVVGDASFTTIGFQTDGKTTKFKIKNVKPESDISYSHEDPFGETGFSSLKFYYGFMVLRPERIALAKVVAEV